MLTALLCGWWIVSTTGKSINYLEQQCFNKEDGSEVHERKMYSLTLILDAVKLGCGDRFPRLGNTPANDVLPIGCNGRNEDASAIPDSAHDSGTPPCLLLSHFLLSRSLPLPPQWYLHSKTYRFNSWPARQDRPSNQRQKSPYRAKRLLRLKRPL